MSFRGRLRLFFTIIVIVPMIAVAIVLFTLSEQSEVGKADAGIAAGLRNASALYREASERAEPALRRVAADVALQEAIRTEDRGAATARMAELVRADRALAAITLYDERRRTVARAGSTSAVAPSAAPLRD